LGGFEIMLTYEKCKKTLNNKSVKYTNEEVYLIREWLYQFAEIIVNVKENEEHSR
jgi:hypothetical protein